MATLETVIALRDKFTNTIQHMTGSTRQLTSGLDNLQAATAHTDTALAGVAGAVNRLNSGFAGGGNAVQQAGGFMTGFAGLAVKAAGRAVAAISNIQTALSVMSLSNEYAQTAARLAVMNDGLQSAAQLQNMIFHSAMNARVAYQATADAVAKMGVLAGETFSGNREMISFLEQVNKQFAISGTSAAGMQTAMLQLTQGMGAGVLSGEALHAALNQAPTIVKTIAKYLNVSTGKLQTMADEGQITSEIVKSAMLAAADETNAAFGKLPVTFGQAFTMAGNVAYQAFTPVWEAVGRIADNKNLDSMLYRLYPVLLVTGTAIAGVIDGVSWLASVVINVMGYAFSWAAAICIIGLKAITAAMPFVLAAVLGLAAGWAVLNAVKLYNIVTDAMIAAYVWMQVTAITAVNAVIAAYRWLVLAVVAAKGMWAMATHGVTVAQTLLAVATWAVSAPLLAVAAVIVGVMVAALAVWGLASLNLRNAFADAMNFMIDACQIGVNTMARMINGLIDIINKAAGGLNSLFGTNIGTIDHVGTVDFQGAKKWSGYIREGTFMENLTGEIGGMLDLPELPNTNNFTSSYDPANAETAKNTKGIQDALGILDEDIKYMRDIADREYISQTKYSTVKIDMSGMSTTVNNRGDLDGYIDGLGQYISERISNAVEGVHEE